MNELTARHNQAFAGATSLPYPLLDQEYVRHVLARLRREGVEPLPSEAAAWDAFQALGHRPEEFLRALGQLRASGSSGLGPDQLLPVIGWRPTTGRPGACSPPRRRPPSARRSAGQCGWRRSSRW